MALDDYDSEFLNVTESGDDHYDSELLYHAVFPTLIFCISLPANSFVLWVLWRERTWKTTSDILLLQLTVSNFCFIVTLPFFACNLLRGWIFGLGTCVLMRGLSFVAVISFPMILAAMVLHCYVTVVGGASWLTAVVSKKSFAVVWLVCAALSIKHAVYSKVLQFNTDKELCSFPLEYIKMLISDIFISTLIFFISFAGIAFCCIHMWISKKPLSTEGPHPPTRLILKLTLAVFICLTPHYVTMFLGVLQFMSSLHLTPPPPFLLFIVTSLAYLYCLVSPLFYIFGEQRFRKYLVMPCKRSSQDQGGSVNSSVPFVILEDA